MYLITLVFVFTNKSKDSVTLKNNKLDSIRLFRNNS